ncbi:MAG: hypothetical protein K2O40_12595, partial [Lachnospiraceae bacterium]|nr:hypothetical protein [Lachnospiraceae bacterium]
GVKKWVSACFINKIWPSDTALVVLLAGDVRLSFLNVLKFDFLVPVPVNNRSIGGGAVDYINMYGIAAEQKLLCSFGIKIRFHDTVHLFLRACLFGLYGYIIHNCKE